jgi:hypothetical protein
MLPTPDSTPPKSVPFGSSSAGIVAGAAFFFAGAAFCLAKRDRRAQQESHVKLLDLAKMADDFQRDDVPGYVLGSFRKSNFKIEYEWAETKPLRVREVHRVLGIVYIIVTEYCQQHGISEEDGIDFLHRLQQEWQPGDDVGLACERVWTSAKTLTRPDGSNIEFCAILSQIMREDRASLSRACAIFARGLKGNLVAADRIAYRPPSGECWRGGGFDDRHRRFFVVGKRYRVPSFLATSTHQHVCGEFMDRAQAKGFPVVEWRITFAAEGCKHVNLLRVTHVAGEEEHLFQAYSVFTVEAVQWSAVTPATTQQPHRITIRAACDNKAMPETLALAPWC